MIRGLFPFHPNSPNLDRDLIPVASLLGVQPGFVRKSKATVTSPASIKLHLYEIPEGFGADAMEDGVDAIKSRSISGFGRVNRTV